MPSWNRLAATRFIIFWTTLFAVDLLQARDALNLRLVLAIFIYSAIRSVIYCFIWFMLFMLGAIFDNKGAGSGYEPKSYIFADVVFICGFLFVAYFLQFYEPGGEFSFSTSRWGTLIVDGKFTLAGALRAISGFYFVLLWAVAQQVVSMLFLRRMMK